MCVAGLWHVDSMIQFLFSAYQLIKSKLSQVPVSSSFVLSIAALVALTTLSCELLSARRLLTFPFLFVSLILPRITDDPCA